MKILAFIVGVLFVFLAFGTHIYYSEQVAWGWSLGIGLYGILMIEAAEAAYNSEKNIR